MSSTDFSAVLREFSPERLIRHTKIIGEVWANRLSGTSALEGAAEYVLGELNSYGLQSVGMQEFDGLISLPLESELRVDTPETRIIPSTAFAQIESTGDEGISGEVVFVGAGGLADYQDKNVRGKVVLAELSLAPPRPEKVRIARLHGAAAVILSNWGSSDSELIPMGTAKYVWGNPTPEDAEAMETPPAIGISRKDGEWLAGLCGRGPVRVRLVAKASREWKSLRQPWARLQGAGDEFVIASAHLDAWMQGITDNAVGVAMLLEIARVLAMHRDRMRRSIEFVFWVGHENGIMEGSTWYVDNAWDRLRDNGVVYLNVDMPVIKGASRYVVWSSPELMRWHRQIDSLMVKRLRPERVPLVKIADQSFLGVGVPSLAAMTLFSSEEIRRWNGAMIGPWFHSERDTMDLFDLDLVIESLEVTATYIADICSSLVLPFEYVTVAEEFADRLSEYQNSVRHHLDLGKLIELAMQLKNKAEDLDGFARSLEDSIGAVNEREDARVTAQAEIANRCLMRLARTLTWARAQVADRYNQDTYGLSELHELLPVLHELPRLSTLDPKGHDYRLLLTKMVRHRNRIADALSDAIWHIDNTMKLLDRLSNDGDL